MPARRAGARAARGRPAGKLSEGWPWSWGREPRLLSRVLAQRRWTGLGARARREEQWGAARKTSGSFPLLPLRLRGADGVGFLGPCPAGERATCSPCRERFPPATGAGFLWMGSGSEMVWDPGGCEDISSFGLGGLQECVCMCVWEGGGGVALRSVLIHQSASEVHLTLKHPCWTAPGGSWLYTSGGRGMMAESSPWVGWCPPSQWLGGIEGTRWGWVGGAGALEEAPEGKKHNCRMIEALCSLPPGLHACLACWKALHEEFRDRGALLLPLFSCISAWGGGVVQQPVIPVAPATLRRPRWGSWFPWIFILMTAGFCGGGEPARISSES